MASRKSSKRQSGDICQRCKERGEDRRILWMACLYEMMELGLPLEDVRLAGRLSRKRGEKEIPSGILKGLKVNIYGKSGSPGKFHFYRLTVCKSCRGDWMNAIKMWFKYPAVDVMESAGGGVYLRSKDTVQVNSGIFIRENGAIREISLAEWNRLHPDRDPVRVVRK